MQRIYPTNWLSYFQRWNEGWQCVMSLRLADSCATKNKKLLIYWDLFAANSKVVIIFKHYKGCFIIKVVSLYRLFHYTGCFIIQVVSLYRLFHYTGCFIIQVVSLYRLFHYTGCFIIQVVSLYRLFHYTGCFIIQVVSLQWNYCRITPHNVRRHYNR